MVDIIYYGATLVVALVAIYVGALVVHKMRDLRFQASAEAARTSLIQARVRQLTADAEFEIARKQGDWSGFRRFLVERVIDECDLVKSFYLKPFDGKPLTPYRPGQFLTFRVHIPGAPKQEIRCYSLSDCSKTDTYRVTIKKIGLVSGYFHEQLELGSPLDVKAPSGDFFLDLNTDSPVVLIAGGIGLTPMLSMLNAILEAGAQREVWLFYGINTARDFIQRERFRELQKKHSNFHLHICCGNVGAADQRGVVYDHAERVSVDLFKRLLPSSNYDYYVCGPGAMMTAIVGDLGKWGVPARNIHYEAFGEATVRKVAPVTNVATDDMAAVKVTFARSNSNAKWTPNAGSLLELMESAGIPIDSGCRAGNCGTCHVAIRSGQVTYLKKAAASIEPNGCLPCIVIPNSDLLLDA